MSKKVSIINFSPRNDGNCSGIGDYIGNFYRQWNVCEFHITADLIPPCRNCNYECLTPGKSCPEVNDYQKDVMDAVCDSDVVYYIVPNFCGYPCANYFAFNERSVGYFNMDRKLMDRYMSARKRFIIVSNTERPAFAEAMKQQTNDEPEILYLKTGKYGKRSTAGDLMESEAAQADLLAFLESGPY